jgi:phage terminase large subunit GpA-like protein
MTAVPALADASLVDALVAVERRELQPPPQLTISEWADEYRVLSRESSAEPGQWQTARAPYLRGIMDAFSDASIETVVFMKAAQVGATEIVNNVVGFHIDYDPGPMLIIQPNVEPMAKAWSKDRLAPMLRDTASLRGKVRDPRSRDSGNTVTHKVFAGGHLTVAGANSAAGLASRPIRILLCDEVDRFPPSAGSEGDPIALGVKRTTTFWNRKIGLLSSPTLKGLSRIEAALGESDERYYHVPCPHCGQLQPLKWKGIQFDRTETGELIEDSVRYQCEACGQLIDELDKLSMLEAGEWIATRETNGIAGFHLNALYSPWARWPELVKEFLRAKGNPERLKVWVNTVLAETWEEEGETMDVEGRQLERHAADVPEGVGILTAGVDLQKDRLEVLVVGWGAGEESWRIWHERIYGDPMCEEVWEQLEVLRTRPYRHVNGATLRIRSVAIDSGSFTQAVYRYVAPLQREGVRAIKGRGEPGYPLVGRPGKANRFGVRVFPIGTHTAKDVLFSRLRITHPGPGYMHFCTQDGEGLDAEYFAQFGAERKITHYVRGVLMPQYKQIRTRNEAIDLDNYALAALHILGRAVTEHLEGWVKRVETEGKREEGSVAEEDEAKEEKHPRARGRRRRGFVQRW